MLSPHSLNKSQWWLPPYRHSAIWPKTFWKFVNLTMAICCCRRRDCRQLAPAHGARRVGVRRYQVALLQIARRDARHPQPFPVRLRQIVAGGSVGVGGVGGHRHHIGGADLRRPVGAATGAQHVPGAQRRPHPHGEHLRQPAHHHARQQVVTLALCTEKRTPKPLNTETVRKNEADSKIFDCGRRGTTMKARKCQKNE